MRLFVAIYPPPEALDDLAAQASRLSIGEAAASGVNVRLAARETQHLTLAFLGDVAEDRLPDVRSALTRAAGDWRRPVRPDRGRGGTDGPERGRRRTDGPEPGRRGTGGPDRARNRADVSSSDDTDASAAGDETSPRLRLGGGGQFGRGAFTILWVGVRGDLYALRALHAAVRRELRYGRLPHDRRPYRPHLTLARPGDRVDRAAVNADRDTLHDYLGPSWPVTEIVLVRSHLGPRPLHHHLEAWSI